MDTRDGVPSRTLPEESSIRGKRTSHDVMGASNASRHCSTTSQISQSVAMSCDIEMQRCAATDTLGRGTESEKTGSGNDCDETDLTVQQQCLRPGPLGTSESDNDKIDRVEVNEENKNVVVIGTMDVACNISEINEVFNTNESSKNNVNKNSYVSIPNKDESKENTTSKSNISHEDEKRTERRKGNDRVSRYVRAVSESEGQAGREVSGKNISRQFSTPEGDRKVCKKVSFHVVEDPSDRVDKEKETAEFSMDI